MPWLAIGAMFVYYSVGNVVEPDQSRMTQSVSIENAEALTGIFGYWPSFHDAEVLSMHLDRGGPDGPLLDARVHVFHMTREIDNRGFFVLTNHTLVTLRFVNILLRELRWFNAQNALNGIHIDNVDPAANEGRVVSVAFDGAHGVDADFVCDRVFVRAVEPFAPAV